MDPEFVSEAARAFSVLAKKGDVHLTAKVSLTSLLFVTRIQSDCL